MLSELISEVRLRVWAEIGRTRMTMSRAVTTQPGEIIELDREEDAPVELYVNGRRLGTGTLLRVGDGEWGVRIESLELAGPGAGGDVDAC